MARECDVKIAVDLQDIRDLDDLYRREFISAADFLFFSAANHGGPGSLIAELLRRNERQIILSGMGAQGCMLGSVEGVHHFEVPELDLPVVDSNGAGDSLAVGFLDALLFDGCSLEESVTRG